MQIRQWERTRDPVPKDIIKPDTRVMWEENVYGIHYPFEVKEGRIIGNEDLIFLKKNNPDFYFVEFNDERFVTVTTEYHLKIPPFSSIKRINVANLVY